ncbi:MAG: helix-turn-helix domain-containing protein [Bradyrhizobium sp.]|nr:helix-turn-helix domain-containing protein [Bradyrhizobium sp.]
MAVASDQSSGRPLPRSVRRALDAMRGHVAHTRSVTDLAAEAGVTSRTLQRQFLTFLSKTPRAMLRDIGFENARRELLQGSPGSKVMDVALRYGFPHCGRFSIEYRRRYDETPSQTLKRQAYFLASVSSQRCSLMPARSWPTLALAKIEAAPDNAELAGHIADDLALALTRAGISVTTQPKSTRYQLIGAIRGSGAESRLIVRLIDIGSGRQLWVDRSDGALADSADVALRAMPGVLSLEAEGNARALDLLERAIEQDPRHALATALAAWAHIQRVVYHFTAEPQRARARSLELAERARTLSGNATVLAVLANALTLLGELDSADTVVRKALAVDGGSAWAWGRSGWIDAYRGDPHSAIERFKISLDLAPRDPLAFNNMVGIGCAHLAAGDFAEAARWQQRALVDHPSATWVHRTMCPAYVLAGAKSEARRSFGALRDQYPELTIAEVQLGMPPLPQLRNPVVDALHDLGLPR